MLDRVFIQEQIVAMQADRYVERTFGARHAGHMVHMGGSQQNPRERDLLSRRKLEQAVDFVAWIDEHGRSRSGAGDDESVFEEWADRLRLDYDHEVILAILDDLLFTSKMRATA